MKIVVTGFASLDYAMRLDRPALPDATATILSRPAPWPRLGGSPAYVCAALFAAGAKDAVAVSWVADDAEGARYREELRRRGLSCEGVRSRPGRTPVCVLAYQPDGGCVCLYDPGVGQPITLDDTQRELVRAADVLCLTVGAAEATHEALTLARPEARVVWAVKADRRATPPYLAGALAVRADLIVHSRAEAAFVDEAFAAANAPQHAPRIETRGGDGLAILADGQEIVVPAEPVVAEDTTGAGDTWLGGFLAAYFLRGEPIKAAAQFGVAGVGAMLSARAAQPRK